MADCVVPGVWWLHGTRGSNVFVIELEDNRLALVDTGFAGSADAIIQEILDLPGDRTPSHLLLTHAHVDHTGSAAALRKHYALEVIAGADDTHQLDRRAVINDAIGRTHPGRRISRALRRRARPAATTTVVDRPLEGEQQILPGLRAVPVPGHTPGSYCYVDDARGVAFVGDLIISHPDTLARPMKLTNTNDSQFLSSLATFAEDAPAIGCPGHGDPVLNNFGDQLRTLAALPRRSPFSPSLLRMRARRMAGFTNRISRPRTRD
ncbi:MAG: MBL fold metallo-hydrolase [Dehalococcoidia bacterium]|jgi:glyoxylase-like metal-dependent hydrolase (beta-lactamase superfamily II)|nr:MBL fold metallo-hydrolase [Dehalococcoidia bacterium]